MNSDQLSKLGMFRAAAIKRGKEDNQAVANYLVFLIVLACAIATPLLYGNYGV
jgi:hypothetical protein